MEAQPFTVNSGALVALPPDQKAEVADELFALARRVEREALIGQLVTTDSRQPESSGALLTPAQVADKAQLTQQRVYRLLERGELRGQKIGKYWRIAERDFEAWASGKGGRK